MLPLRWHHVHNRLRTVDSVKALIPTLLEHIPKRLDNSNSNMWISSLQVLFGLLPCGLCRVLYRFACIRFKSPDASTVLMEACVRM